MHAYAHKRQKCVQLLISFRMRVNDAYVPVRARIIMKIYMLVVTHTDSLGFKFYEDPFISWGEIEKTRQISALRDF